MTADTHASTGVRPEGSRGSRGAASARRVAGVFARSRLGSTAIEFAFAAPVLLLFFFAMFELTRMVWVQITLELAVEEAARFAIVNDGTYATDTLFKTAIDTETKNNAFEIDKSAATLKIETTIDRSSTPVYVQVEATYAFKFYFNAFDVWDATAFNITAKSRLPMVE